MNDSLPQMSSFKRGFILFAFGLLVGVMGANAVADAAGLGARSGSDENIMLRVLCGFILGLATIALVMVVGHFGSMVIVALRQSPRRPNLYMASGVKRAHPDTSA